MDNNVVAGNDACSWVWAISSGSDTIVLSYEPIGLSGSSIPAAALVARKAVRTLATLRQFWGVNNGGFAALMGT